MIEVTTDKKKQLANLEKDFDKHKVEADRSEKNTQAHWYEMGCILSKIRDKKLYPQRTFEQYCLQRWDIKRARAYQFCKAYDVVKKLPPVSTIVDNNNVEPEGVTTESQARELGSVPESDRPEVLEEAKKNGRVTAKSIKTAARRVKTKHEIPKDREGLPIPTPAMAVWLRRDEVKEKLTFLGELKQWADDMQGTGDPLYAEVSFSGLLLDIEKVISILKTAVPYVVCSACQGQAPNTCTMCKGRGMISRFRYHGIPATPDSMKEIRQKVSAQS